MIFDKLFQNLGFCENTFEIVFQYALVCFVQINDNSPNYNHYVITLWNNQFLCEYNWSLMYIYKFTILCYFINYSIGCRIIKQNIKFEKCTKNTNLLDFFGSKQLGNDFNVYNWLHYEGWFITEKIKSYLRSLK